MLLLLFSRQKLTSQCCCFSCRRKSLHRNSGASPFAMLFPPNRTPAKSRFLAHTRNRSQTYDWFRPALWTPWNPPLQALLCSALLLCSAALLCCSVLLPFSKQKLTSQCCCFPFLSKSLHRNSGASLFARWSLHVAAPFEAKAYIAMLLLLLSQQKLTSQCCCFAFLRKSSHRQ